MRLSETIVRQARYVGAMDLAPILSPIQSTTRDAIDRLIIVIPPWLALLSLSRMSIKRAKPSLRRMYNV